MGGCIDGVRNKEHCFVSRRNKVMRLFAGSHQSEDCREDVADVNPAASDELATYVEGKGIDIELNNLNRSHHDALRHGLLVASGGNGLIYPLLDLVLDLSLKSEGLNLPDPAHGLVELLSTLLHLAFDASLGSLDRLPLQELGNGEQGYHGKHHEHHLPTGTGRDNKTSGKRGKGLHVSGETLASNLTDVLHFGG